MKSEKESKSLQSSANRLQQIENIKKLHLKFRKKYLLLLPLSHMSIVVCTKSTKMVQKETHN